MQLQTATSNPTMSSREIADLVEARHERLGFQPGFAAGLDRAAQHVARGDVEISRGAADAFGQGALARAGRAEEDDGFHAVLSLVLRPSGGRADGPCGGTRRSGG